MSEGTPKGGEGVRLWRVPVVHLVVKTGGAILFAVLAALSVDDPQFVLLALVAAVGLAALALRDALAPVRVAADTAGLTVVAGYAGRRRLTWPEVTAIRVDERRRILIHTRLLEIETSDDLYLFSAFDLGADVQDAAEELRGIRARAIR